VPPHREAVAYLSPGSAPAPPRETGPSQLSTLKALHKKLVARTAGLSGVRTLPTCHGVAGMLSHVRGPPYLAIANRVIWTRRWRRGRI
jgi:hypothetical protein